MVAITPRGNSQRSSRSSSNQKSGYKAAVADDGKEHRAAKQKHLNADSCGAILRKSRQEGIETLDIFYRAHDKSGARKTGDDKIATAKLRIHSHDHNERAEAIELSIKQFLQEPSSFKIADFNEDRTAVSNRKMTPVEIKEICLAIESFLQESGSSQTVVIRQDPESITPMLVSKEQQANFTPIAEYEVAADGGPDTVAYSEASPHTSNALGLSLSSTIGDPTSPENSQKSVYKEAVGYQGREHSEAKANHIQHNTCGGLIRKSRDGTSETLQLFCKAFDESGARKTGDESIFEIGIANIDPPPGTDRTEHIESTLNTFLSHPDNIIVIIGDVKSIPTNYDVKEMCLAIESFLQENGSSKAVFADKKGNFKLDNKGPKSNGTPITEYDFAPRSVSQGMQNAIFGRGHSPENGSSKTVVVEPDGKFKLANKDQESDDTPIAEYDVATPSVSKGMQNAIFGRGDSPEYDVASSNPEAPPVYQMAKGGNVIDKGAFIGSLILNGIDPDEAEKQYDLAMQQGQTVDDPHYEVAGQSDGPDYELAMQQGQTVDDPQYELAGQSDDTHYDLATLEGLTATDVEYSLASNTGAEKVKEKLSSQLFGKPTEPEDPSDSYWF